jgi:hypothetical protein
MPGRRTSVYLSEAEDAALKASGLPLPEVIRRGLQIAGRRGPQQPPPRRGRVPQVAFRAPPDCPRRAS